METSFGSKANTDYKDTRSEPIKKTANELPAALHLTYTGPERGSKGDPWPLRATTEAEYLRQWDCVTADPAVITSVQHRHSDLKSAISDATLSECREQTPHVYLPRLSFHTAAGLLLHLCGGDFPHGSENCQKLFQNVVKGSILRYRRRAQVSFVQKPVPK